MISVSINDPTTYDDLLRFCIIIMSAFIVCICLSIIFKSKILKLISILTAFAILIGVSFAESNRELNISEANQTKIEQAYNITDLETNDRLGFDPGYGITRIIQVSWYSNDKHYNNGLLVMDYPKNGKATARLEYDNGEPVN